VTRSPVKRTKIRATPKQIRRDALLGSGPKFYLGQQRSRRNSLTAETLICDAEDRDHYRAFEASIVESYAPASAIAYELAARLASLLWRLRRATAIETGMFQVQADTLAERRRLGASPPPRTAEVVRQILAKAQAKASRSGHLVREPDSPSQSPADTAQCFLRLANLKSNGFERVSRYEAALWRQAAQIMLLLGQLAPRSQR
jgi:hypothetical protein